MCCSLEGLALPATVALAASSARELFYLLLFTATRQWSCALHLVVSLTDVGETGKKDTPVPHIRTCSIYEQTNVFILNKLVVVIIVAKEDTTNC